METVSKKRGRPTIYERIFGENAARAKALETITLGDAESERSKTNVLYFNAAFELLHDLPWFKSAFFTERGNCCGKCILEQIGRMKLQNGFDDELCIIVAEKAAEFLDKYTVREIERWIRHGRNTNDW